MNNTFLHYCNDWDQMIIDMLDGEIECCTCFNDIVNWHLVAIERHLYNKDCYWEGNKLVWQYD